MVACDFANSWAYRSLYSGTPAEHLENPIVLLLKNCPSACVPLPTQCRCVQFITSSLVLVLLFCTVPAWAPIVVRRQFSARTEAASRARKEQGQKQRVPESVDLIY